MIHILLKRGLSARAYNHILKVSRSSADLDGYDEVREAQIAESRQYRTLKRNFWL